MADPGYWGESFLFIPDLTAKATGGGADRADRPLRRHAAALGPRDGGQRRQKPADDDDVLPFIFVPFIISFPAGLVLYWITTNIWTIGQQYAIQKGHPAAPLQTPEEKAAAKPPPPPPKKKRKRRR